MVITFGFLSCENHSLHKSVNGGIWKQEISLNKDYDEVIEDVFYMSNMRIFKEIAKKKWGMFIICYVFGQLGSVKRLV